MRTIVLVILLLVIAFAFAFHTHAETPGDRPGYLHALTDLRTARFYLTREHVGNRDHLAIESIDHAIADIKQASVDDGKNLNDHPPIDTSLDEKGRFHKALELLKKAHHDIGQEEDNAAAQGLQHRALLDIDQAHHIVKDIIESW